MYLKSSPEGKVLMLMHLRYCLYWCMPRSPYLSYQTVNNLPREFTKLPNCQDAKLPIFPYAESKLSSYHVVRVCKVAELPSCWVVETPSRYYCSCRNKMTAPGGLKLPSCQDAELPCCPANVKRHWSKWARYQQDYWKMFNLDHRSAPSILMPLPKAFCNPDGFFKN